VLLGSELFRYDTENYLLVSMQLPLVSRIVEASEDDPYLAFRLVLDPAMIAAVMVDAGEAALRGGDSVRGLAVSVLEQELSDAILRLVRLVDSPLEYRMLAPLVKREIVFRLLMGQQGARLRHVAVLGGQSHRIAKAVDRLKASFDKPLRIEDLARDLGMSVSGFHHHFKAVTAMSPLQFQKQIRLQEARRLMLGDGLDAASAGHKVGYDNPSHFSREYKRLFGEPPMRDVERLQALAVG
jgi:AraC-like DNA-binding protein